MRSVAGLVLLLAGVSSCRAVPAALPPVPVEGRAHDRGELAGRWSGEFHDERTGRHGSITFSLAPGRDTAFALVEVAGGPPGLLRLGRVGVLEGSIAGWLLAYPDPEAGCLVDTWFEGELHGDALVGHYFSRPEDCGRPRQGTWELTRHLVE